MENILDLITDNWLILVRLELDVTVDNEKTISLYQYFGFKIKGTKKYAIIKDGKYASLFMMVRYNIPTQFK